MQTITTTNQLQFQTNNNNNMKSPATINLIDLYNDAVSVLSSEEIYSRYQHDFNSDHNGKMRGKPPFRESKSGQSFTVFPDKGFFDIDMFDKLFLFTWNDLKMFIEDDILISY